MKQTQQVTALSQAYRKLDTFTLNAVSGEHRAKTEDLYLSPKDYRAIWDKVHSMNLNQLDKKTLNKGEDFAEALRLSYIGNRQRYSLTIKKVFIALSVAA